MSAFGCKAVGQSRYTAPQLTSTASQPFRQLQDPLPVSTCRRRGKPSSYRDDSYRYRNTVNHSGCGDFTGVLARSVAQAGHSEKTCTIKIGKWFRAIADIELIVMRVEVAVDDADQAVGNAAEIRVLLKYRAIRHNAGHRTRAVVICAGENLSATSGRYFPLRPRVLRDPAPYLSAAVRWRCCQGIEQRPCGRRVAGG